MQDVRSALKLADPKVIPQTLRSATNFITIHYNGPAVGDTPSLRLLQADARFHVDTRGWDGLSYHYAVGKDGEQFMCRDHTARLNHSGVSLGNSESLAVLVILGEGEIPPPHQISSLENLLTNLGIGARYTLGHRFWPRATQCPGAALTRWLDYYYARYSGKVQDWTVKWPANIRDEPSVLSHLVGKLPVGRELTGTDTLANPVKGDALWIKISDKQFVHASALTLRGRG